MAYRTFPSDNELIEQVCTLVSQTFELPPELLPLEEETCLYGKGVGLDSFDVLQLVVALEEQFDIMIEEEDLALSSLESIGAIASLIRRKLTS